MIRISLSKESYNLDETLHSGQAFRWRKNEASTKNENVWHEGIVQGRRVRLIQSQTGIEAISPKSSEELTPFLSNYLAIDYDLSSFYTIFRSDKYLSEAIRDYSGLHVLRQDPWECLIAFICSANNNIPRIKSLIEKISRACGTEHRDIFGTYFAFPTPTQLSIFGEQSLRSIGLGFRAKYVSKASAMVNAGDIDLCYLRTTNYSTALEQLTTIPGVGDKVANCVLLFSLEKLESFPVDVWIKRAMRETYIKDSDVELPDTKIRTWAQDKFGVYSGYVNQYLFHSRRLSNS